MSSLELVKKLAARGANVNARMTKRANLNNTRLNEIGATPFLLAALTADAELMKTLAALGADPLLPNAENSTPLMVAAGLATRSPGEDAGTESEVLEAVQVALDLGADVNAVDNNGETAMHGAAYKNLPKVVKFLAAKGAKIDVWNQDEQVRLDAAGHRRRLPVRQLQAVARNRGRDSRGDDRRRRHAAEDGRRQDPADLLASTRSATPLRSTHSDAWRGGASESGRTAANQPQLSRLRDRRASTGLRPSAVEKEQVEHGDAVVLPASRRRLDCT